MSFIFQIQEIVEGPIKELYLALTTGPLFTFPALPPVNVQVGPETVGNIPLGSTFGDANLGSTVGNIPLGSTFGNYAPSLGSTNGAQNLGSTGLNPSFGSTNGAQNLGSTGLVLPGSSESPVKP